MFGINVGNYEGGLFFVKKCYSYNNPKERWMTVYCFRDFKNYSRSCMRKIIFLNYKNQYLLDFGWGFSISMILSSDPWSQMEDLNYVLLLIIKLLWSRGSDDSITNYWKP